MSQLDDETLDDLSDPLLRALARTPEVAPFAGTGRYRVQSCLGEGGFGVVYEVEDRQLGRRLALKMLKAQRSGLAGNIGRFKREFRSVADLVHPNLVGLHELSADGARWFFTMDLVRGRDFLAHVRDDSGEAHVRLRAALRQLVTGVHALHQAGILHRDLKPSNVLVEPDGRVVILDFGLAGSELGVDLDLPVAGTPVYMAPEVASGLPATSAADWYAVGVMLYQALHGTIPPPSGPPRPRHHGPADLERLCLALLAREPAARPDAAAILASLGAPSTTPSETRRAEPRSLFVGRERELAELRAGFAAVRGGKAALVRIHGQPGVGKSALLDRFFAGVSDGEAIVLTARCHERESVPFKAFDGVADALVRYLNGLPRSHAAALMPRDIHLVAQLFPAFESVSAVRDVPRRQARLADPRELRLRAFAAVKELVGRIADKQPMVVAIDDLQWSDIDSARLLSHLVAPPERPPLLLLLSYRDEEAAQSPILRETLRMLEATGERGVDLALQPLPAGDAEKLAASLLGKAADAGAARAIAERGEGHPLFIAELARALLLSDTAGDAPPTLLDILWRRVVQLSEGARALLETLAVAGQPLPSHLCFEAAGLAGRGVEAVRVLRSEQLVRAADNGSINVFHDRIRDAVLLGADAARQRQRHLDLARSLERTPGCDPEILARHFDAAEERAQAARYALRAADAAMGALAFDRAAALYRMAIDRGAASASAEVATLHEKLGDALLHAGSSADAGRAYLAAAGHAGGPHATDLRRRASELLLTVGDVEPGYRALEQALADVGEKVPATLTRAGLEGLYHISLLRLARFRFRERDPDTISRQQLLRLDVLESAARGLGYIGMARSFAVAMRFSRLALKMGDPRRAALGLTWSVYGMIGVLRRRRAIIDQMLDAADRTAERLADNNLRAWSMRTRGESLYHFGEFDRALEVFDRGAAYISDQCTGMASDQRHLRMYAAASLTRQGRLAEARVIADSLLLDAVEREDPVAEKCVCVAVLAPLSLAAGDPDRADEFLTRGQREDRCGIVVLRAETMAAIALYRGRPREATDAWRCSWSLIQDEGMLMPPADRLLAARSLGIALLVDPRGREDVSEARRLARSIRRLDFGHAAAVRDCLRAYFLLRERRPARAAELLRRAAGAFQACSMDLDAAACRHRAGLIVGGAEGEAMAAAAETDLRDLGIAFPAKWAAMRFPALA